MRDEFDQDHLKYQIGRGPIGRGVTAATVALLAGASGPAAPLVVGSFGAMEAFGDHLNQEVAKRDQAVLAALAMQSDMTIADALEQVRQNERLLFLTGLVIDSARRSTLNDKARHLGRCLGSILKDDALIDRETIWIKVISGVEPVHIRLLGHFITAETDQVTGEKFWMKRGNRKLRFVAQTTKLDELVIPLAQDLLQLGLLEDPSPANAGLVSGNPLWGSLDLELRATELAPALMKRLNGP